MRAGIFAERWRAGLGHVLHHDVARGKSFNEQRSLVADHRAEPLLLAQRHRRRARARFLSEAEIHTANDLALLVEILERRLHAAVEQHPAVERDVLLATEVL